MNYYNLQEIFPLSNEPDKKDDFDLWIQQQDVIPFLDREIEDEYIIIFASLPHVYIHGILIPKITLDDDAINYLTHLNHDPYSGWSYVMSSSAIWIEGPLDGHKSARKGLPIFFARSFDGYKGKERYYELNQEIAQALEIHYLPERQAWCRFDKFGDLEDVVSIKKISDLPNNETGIIILAKKDVLGSVDI